MYFEGTYSIDPRPDLEHIPHGGFKYNKNYIFDNHADVKAHFDDTPACFMYDLSCNNCLPWWFQCSVECGKGVQHRSVFCAGKVGGMYQEFPVDACPRKKKPKTTRSCGKENCAPQWYTSDWKEVSTLDGTACHHHLILQHKKSDLLVVHCAVIKCTH